VAVGKTIIPWIGGCENGYYNLKRALYHIILGSNLCDREALMSQAREQLVAHGGEITEASALYETQPWGYDNQPWFINQAVAYASDIEPLQLLQQCKAIETSLGRLPGEQWHARHIDVDIVLCGSVIVKEESLILPHPRMHERNFVLIPLMEIAPLRVHPVFHKTVEELYLECRDQGEVYIFNADDPHGPV
jgi:2-amino-4-hydroxy-6-hydroxymethyldihydropteridine diphosphokinase